MRWSAAALTIFVPSLLCGRASPEIARFQARPGQEAVVRDGQPAIVSRRPGSIVIVRPASRQFQAGRRPVYVVAMYNLTTASMQFSVANLSVVQVRGGQAVRALKVYTYEELVAEERNRQVARALIVGLAAGANAVSAANAGYYNANATVYGPRGVSNVSVSGYDPTAAAIAQSNAAAQNDAMIAGVVETGRRNLDVLERSAIKDNTLFPREWYGGHLQFDPPEGDDKTYQITVQVGPDVHLIDVTHERPSS